MGSNGSASVASRLARTSVSASVIRYWAGFASLGAGLIHLAVVQEHLSEGWSYGVFFLVLGVLQIAWAAFALLGDELPMPRRFAALNAAVILLWLVSRTVGLPIGPEPWKAEAVGTADLLCSGIEAVLIALLVVLTRRPAAEESPSLTKVQRRLVVVGALAVAAVTVMALTDTDPSRISHHHSAHSALGYEFGDSRLVGGSGPSLHLDQVEGSFDEPDLGVGQRTGWVRMIEPASPVRLG